MSRKNFRTAVGISVLALGVAASAGASDLPGYGTLNGEVLNQNGTRADTILGATENPIPFQVMPSVKRWADQQSQYSSPSGWLGDISTNDYNDYKETLDKIRESTQANEALAMEWLLYQAQKRAKYYQDRIVPKVQEIQAKIGMDHGKLNTGHTRDRRNRIRSIPPQEMASYKRAFDSFDESFENQITLFIGQVAPEVSKKEMELYYTVAKFNAERNGSLASRSGAAYDSHFSLWKTPSVPLGPLGTIPSVEFRPGKIFEWANPISTRAELDRMDRNRHEALVEVSEGVLTATADFQETLAFLQQVRGQILLKASTDGTRLAYLQSQIRKGADARQQEFENSYEAQVIHANGLAQ